MRTKLSKTKNKIIHVAKSLFSEMSVYKATMNDIAQAANMSRRTLYMHFKSKEEIYHIRYDFIFNNLRVEQLRKGIDMKERQLLTRILQNGKEQGLFNINNPSSFAKTLLIMFKSLEQPFIIIGHRKRNYQSLREYVDLLFNGILNKG